MTDPPLASAAVSSPGLVRAPGRPGGPAARLPYLVRALDGTIEIDRVPLDDRRDEIDGSIRMTGRGRLFDVAAVWSPVDDPVPHWDVAIDVLLRSGPAVHAGLVVALELDPVPDPHWLIPGLFYGENRPAASGARYPRFARADGPAVAAAAADDPGDPWTSDSWSFRCDRTATPAVFARDTRLGAALATTEMSLVGLTGVGFGAGGDATEIRLLFPFREEPISYDGSPTMRPADLGSHAWPPGEPVRLDFRVYLTDTDPHAYAAVLRDLHAWLAPSSPLGPWVEIEAAAELAADGLLDWHFRPDPAVLYETAAFERHGDGRGDEPADRAAMHVGWISGAPAASALVAHGRRTGQPRVAEAGAKVLDHIAANLAPCGTFWGQWTADRGWGKGWTPGEETLHSRTAAEATLFMGRAAGPGPGPGPGENGGIRHEAWLRAVASNLDFIVGHQRPDGALPSGWHGRTGEIASWEGTAGLAWVPALVEGARLLGRPELLEAARRAGARYASFVEDEFLFGAPEDVDLGPTSEDGYVAVMAYVSLAEAEAEGTFDQAPGSPWVDLARRAADWTLTFRYAYNVAFPATTLLARYDYRSRGADQASPANQHLHGYGLVCLPEMVRLGRLRGDAYYLERTRENLACFRQFIARSDGDFNARRGMAPERYYQTACFGPKGAIGALSHAWCLGLLLHACDAAADLPELASTSGLPARTDPI
jgi:hypothetical protein